MKLPLVALVTIAALPAFAKSHGGGGGGHSSGGHSSGGSHSSSSASHASSSSSSSHGSAPARGTASPHGTFFGGSSGSVHGATSVPHGTYGYAGTYTGGHSVLRGDYGYTPWRYGFYSGCYVPRYGYGYGYVVDGGQTVIAEEDASLRVTAGLDGLLYVAGNQGVTLGATAQFEDETWGFVLAGQNMMQQQLDSFTFASSQEVSARVTMAFLSGKYGRLRAELGGTAVFSPTWRSVGVTGGLSGSLWVGGPFALEGSALVTPWPYLQYDYRAGLAVGAGPVGFRAGWRTEVIDDRGVVDGVVHRTTMMGPYVGVSLVF